MHSRGKLPLAIALFAAALAAAGCPGAEDIIEEIFKPPRVSVRNVAVSGISTDAIDLVLDLRIDNDNPVGLTLAKVDYNLGVEGSPLASGATGTGITLKASGASDAQVPLSFAYQEFKNIYDKAKGKDYIDYTLAGQVHLDTPVGDIPIPYSTSGKLPVVRPPKVKSVGINVKSLNITGADLGIQLNMENPNAFPLQIEGFNYNLDLEGKDFASGLIDSGKIAPKSAGVLEVPLTLDFMSAGNWAYSLLTKKKASYNLDYNATYMIENHPVKQSENKSGKIDFSR